MECGVFGVLGLSVDTLLLYPRSTACSGLAIMQSNSRLSDAQRTTHVNMGRWTAASSLTSWAIPSSKQETKTMVETQAANDRWPDIHNFCLTRSHTAVNELQTPESFVANAWRTCRSARSRIPSSTLRSKSWYSLAASPPNFSTRQVYCSTSPRKANSDAFSNWTLDSAVLCAALPSIRALLSQ